MNRTELVAQAFSTIQAGSQSFRAASRLFDRETRERAWLLYCWCRHCDDVCDGQELGFGTGARGDVAGLREKTDRAAAGIVSNELPFEALRQLLAERPIPIGVLHEHLAGFELDAAGWGPRTREDLIRYCYHVAGTVGSMMAIVMGVPDDDQATLRRAADLGIAFQLSNIARDLREDFANGRCYIPSQWLSEYAVKPDQLFERENQAGLSAIVDRLLAEIVEREGSARAGVKRLPFRSRLAVLAAARIYGAIGRQVGSLGPQAWDERVTIGKTRKLGFLAPSFIEAISHGPRA